MKHTLNVLIAAASLLTAPVLHAAEKLVSNAVSKAPAVR